MDYVAKTAINEAAAKLKRGEARCGIGVALSREVSPPGLDGVRWRFVATDGKHWCTIDAGISGSATVYAGVPDNRFGLERMVERAAGRFPIETRLADMRAASPLTLRT
jgi:hypothetical protein